MFDPADLYRRAALGAVAVADGIRSDQLELATPCAEWTVQDLLDHLVGGTGYLGAAIAGTDPAPPPAGSTAEDLMRGIAACLEGLSDPAVLERTCRSPLGTDWSVGEAAAGTAMDLVVHTWDLATATGQQVELDPVVVDACIEMFLPHMPEMARSAGIVGAAVEVGPGAPPQQVLLGAMGRHA